MVWEFCWTDDSLDTSTQIQRHKQLCSEEVKKLLASSPDAKRKSSYDWLNLDVTLLCIIEDLKEDKTIKQTGGKDLDTHELTLHWRLGLGALSDKRPTGSRLCERVVEQQIMGFIMGKGHTQCSVIKSNLKVLNRTYLTDCQLSNCKIKTCFC